MDRRLRIKLITEFCACLILSPWITRNAAGYIQFHYHIEERPRTAERVFAGFCLQAKDRAEQGDEKAARSLAQMKIDSRLLFAIYQKRGEAAVEGVPTRRLGLKRDEKGRVLVDVRARVTKSVTAYIEKLDGKIVATSERYNSVLAYISLERLEELAGLKSVVFIGPAAEAVTNR